MKYLLCCLLLFMTFHLHAQSFLNGFVLDSLKQPLPFSAAVVLYGDSTLVGNNSKDIKDIDSIWIQPVLYYSYTDNTGAFHLLVENEKDINIRVSVFKYVTKEIHFDSLPTEPIHILMEKDTTPAALKYQPYKKRNWFNRHPTEISMGMDLHSKKYDNFESLLGEQNVTYLNLLAAQFTLEFGKKFNKVYTGMEFGLSPETTKEVDGINIQTSGNLIAFHLGYELYKHRWSYLMPKVSIKRYRYRLINSPDVDNVPLQTYLQQTDLDLRFIQPVADAGVTMGYKYVGKDWIPGAYLLVGMSCGYAVSLRDEANIKGLRSKISTTEGIDVGKLSLSFFFRSHFE